MTLIGGRERFLVDVGSYQKGKLSGFTPTSATLVKHQNGSYSVNIPVKNDAPSPIEFDDVIGVDLGRTDIAVTSEGESFSGKQITQIRDKHSRVRVSLQKKAEDLTGIRERTNQQPRSKTERRRSNSWAFYQLRQFIDYKALGAGVTVFKINPAYTSQTCHKCLHIHPVKGKCYRSGKTFECGHCGWKGDADFNGASMIKVLGLIVNQPRGSYLSCELRRQVEYFQPSLFDLVQGY